MGRTCRHGPRCLSHTSRSIIRQVTGSCPTATTVAALRLLVNSASSTCDVNHFKNHRRRERAWTHLHSGKAHLRSNRPEDNQQQCPFRRAWPLWNVGAQTRSWRQVAKEWLQDGCLTSPASCEDVHPVSVVAFSDNEVPRIERNLSQQHSHSALSDNLSQLSIFHSVAFEHRFQHLRHA